MISLQVWANGERVGTVMRVDGLWSFAYHPDWRGFMLAPYFPIRPEGFHDQGSDRRVEWFFDNLLPEGYMRELLARREGVSPHDSFALLARFGRDTAGALTLVPDGEELPTDAELEQLEKAALNAMIMQTRANNQPLIGAFAQTHMSLAGAQEKMGLHIDAEGKLFLPLGHSPSTHIIKPTNAEQRFPFCPANEDYCMNLADRLDLVVPEVTLWHLPEPVYVVRRFDRGQDGAGNWQRLHQLDLCQLLGLPARKKYESEGGLGLEELFAGLQQLQGAHYTPLPVLQWIIFNYLIGNNDAHAKNIGFFLEDGKPVIAPFYDLLCVEAYLPGQGMAMSIGGENRPGWVEKVHWQNLAEVANVPYDQLFQLLAWMTSTLTKQLSPNQVRIEQYHPDEYDFLSRKVFPIFRQRIAFIQEALGGEAVWQDWLLTGVNEAKRKIEIVRQGRGYRLSLHWFELTVLPNEIANLTQLQFLNCRGTHISDLTPIANLNTLQSLDCGDTLVTDLTPIAALPMLKALECRNTALKDLGPLTTLKSLQRLGCHNTSVSDLTPLAALQALETLDFRITPVHDLSPLATLTALKSLDCSYTQVTNLTPLAALPALQSLDCSHTQVHDFAPLATLPALQSIYFSNTPVSDLTPLAALVTLQSLYCHETQVSDLTALAYLPALQNLDCSSTRVSDLTPLARLTTLEYLDFSGTQVCNLAPLTSLSALKKLSISQCQIQHLPPSLILKQCVEDLQAYKTTIPQIPLEVLSQRWDDNCLPRLRAHLLDLEAGVTTITSAKLMLLGNGMVGKTQLCRRLRNMTFDPTIPSTHGVQVRSIPHTQGEWHTWDFGGQDIYHSTHALFMRTRAVFVLVWSPTNEIAGTHEMNGTLFRNHPLEYWVQYVRHTAGTACPLLIVQTRCEQAQDEVRQLPLPDDFLNDFQWCKILQYSSQNNRGRAALDEALQDAHNYLLAQHPATTGRGRLRVQQALCAWRDADADLPPEQRLHRLVSQREFTALCEQGQGDVSAPAALLDYLHHSGMVFYRESLFSNQIILDQGWALEAIYTVFEREKCWKPLRQLQGRFTRSLLASLIWDGHSKEEQELFLSMMCSCGVAFIHRDGDEDQNIETEYIAPDLLPEKATISAQLEEKWDDSTACETASIAYDLFQPGLLRTIVAKIGSLAGINGLYWQRGVCVYEQTTRSRVLIEQVTPEDGAAWHGQIQVKTQGPQPAQLLLMLQKQLKEHSSGWKLQMQTHHNPELAAASPALAELQFVAEPAKTIRYGVSYVWAESCSQLVEDLCQAAEARGISTLRDKTTLGIGDQIAPFMQQLATQDRVFVILSEKYLKSPNCMYELFEIWRNARLSDADFLARIRVYSLPDADIFSPAARANIASHWKTEFAKLNELVKQHGADILGAEDFKNYKRMQNFSHHIGDILFLVADTLQPKSFEELLQTGFN